MSPDVIRYAVEVVVALGGGALLARLLTIRQERALMAAQASDTQASGPARIIDAAAAIVEQHAGLVPDLLQRITQLEGREAIRQTEFEELYRFADDAVHWMHNALRVVQELGGEIPAPPIPPPRRTAAAV